MRLLHTTSLEFGEFIGTDIPPYVILSHTWGGEEVSFQDFLSDHSRIESRAGYRKIKSCCSEAASHGFEWVWVDTCCIDKKSSAELSEAINSMYAWYQDAEVCYVYLADVPNEILENPAAEDSRFMASRWFTRGWTLQELLAPSTVVFYAGDWSELGTRQSLERTIEDVTRIDLGRFYQLGLHGFSVAQKMFWASHRQTTRQEDMAYCLMGILNVNMPLLYGEGERAFLRLQEAVLRISDDDSIFAWDPRRPGVMPALAPSPAMFNDSRNTKICEPRPNATFTLTNRGIETELLLVESYTVTVVAILNCSRKAGHFVGLALKYSRSDCYNCYTILDIPRAQMKKAKPKRITLLQEWKLLSPKRGLRDGLILHYWLDMLSLQEQGFVEGSLHVRGREPCNIEPFKDADIRFFSWQEPLASSGVHVTVLTLSDPVRNEAFTVFLKADNRTPALRQQCLMMSGTLNKLRLPEERVWSRLASSDRACLEWERGKHAHLSLVRGLRRNDLGYFVNISFPDRTSLSSPCAIGGSIPVRTALNDAASP